MSSQNESQVVLVSWSDKPQGGKYFISSLLVDDSVPPFVGTRLEDRELGSLGDSMVRHSLFVVIIIPHPQDLSGIWKIGHDSLGLEFQK
jgi:hypothetical protein